MRVSPFDFRQSVLVYLLDLSGDSLRVVSLSERATRSFSNLAPPLRRRDQTHQCFLDSGEVVRLEDDSELARHGRRRTIGPGEGHNHGTTGECRFECGLSIIIRKSPTFII